MKILILPILLFLTFLLPFDARAAELEDYHTVDQLGNNFITFSAGSLSDIVENQIVQIHRYDLNAQRLRRIAQAQVKLIAMESSEAEILGTPTEPIEVGDFVLIFPEIADVDDKLITIDWGLNQRLEGGWTAKVLRFKTLSEQQTRIKKLVGRLLLSEIQENSATARILGKPIGKFEVGDFVRIERHSEVRQRSGDKIYLDLSTDLMGKLKPKMEVYIFRNYRVFHPGDAERILEWQEKISKLTIDRVAEGSYSATASVSKEPHSEVLPRDRVLLREPYTDRKIKSSREIHILRIESEQIYLNKFDGAIVGRSFAMTLKNEVTNEVDSESPTYNLTVKAVHDNLIVATFTNQFERDLFKVGDVIGVAIYR